MNTDLATQMLALTSARTAHSMQIAMLKSQQDMDRTMLAMIDEAVRAVPPPAGQGLKVDKTA